MNARPAVDVRVHDHARARARERFPGFKAARIVDEVRAALAEGRLSPEKPPGIDNPASRRCLYAWTPGGERVYALRQAADAFVVITTMRAER